MYKPKFCKRLVIYPKDVENLTGKGLRASQVLLQNIRKHYGKEKHQLISISEFCSYTGLHEDHVKEMIF